MALTLGAIESSVWMSGILVVLSSLRDAPRKERVQFRGWSWRHALSLPYFSLFLTLRKKGRAEESKWLKAAQTLEISARPPPCSPPSQGAKGRADLRRRRAARLVSSLAHVNPPL